jgi:hypothetical protein
MKTNLVPRNRRFVQQTAVRPFGQSAAFPVNKSAENWTNTLLPKIAAHETGYFCFIWGSPAVQVPRSDFFFSGDQDLSVFRCPLHFVRRNSDNLLLALLVIVCPLQLVSLRNVIVTHMGDQVMGEMRKIRK